MFHKVCLPGTMTERLQANAPSPGEQVYEDSILYSSSQYIKQCLPHLATGWADPLPSHCA
jgi:hypothetical protein